MCVSKLVGHLRAIGEGRGVTLNASPKGPPLARRATCCEKQSRPGRDAGNRNPNECQRGSKSGRKKISLLFGPGKRTLLVDLTDKVKVRVARLVGCFPLTEHFYGLY